MEITFKTKKLEKECNNYKETVKAYGDQQARKIIQRLNELRAFETLEQVPSYPPMSCHPLEGKQKGQLAITSKQPFRIIIQPDHDPLPLKADGSLDMSKVTQIKIMGVENYHDK